VLSPVPAYKSLADPQTMFQVQSNLALENDAKQRIVAGDTDQMNLPAIQYPDWMSNAPGAPSAPTMPGQLASVTPSSYDPNEVAKMIQSGFQKYNPQVPAGKYAKEFAQAGEGLPDQLLPAILAIKETSGGTKISHKNNYLNIGPEIDYPSPESNIVGGQGKLGFKGLLNTPAYKEYMKTGNLEDFFKVYTPHTDKNGKVINDSYAKQIQDYNKYRKYFTG
jgi:hypothetical protein